MTSNNFDLARLIERRKTTLGAWLEGHRITTVEELATELEVQGLFASPTLIADAVHLLEPVQMPGESIPEASPTTETPTATGITDKAPGDVTVVDVEPVKSTRKKLGSKNVLDPV